MNSSRSDHSFHSRHSSNQLTPSNQFKPSPPLKSSTARLRYVSAAFIAILSGVMLNSCGSPNQPELRQSRVVDEDNPVANPNPPYQAFRSTEAKGEKNFASLINRYAQAKTDPLPWAGYWWPYMSNGIAAGGFSSGQSPAGKYDAARGHRTHAQEWEARKHSSSVPQVQQWWGHCNGWCVASALFREPREPAKVNGISFGIGDIKALLTEVGMSVSADFFGERVDNFDNLESPKYWDTIPNQYFLVLTNYIGIRNQAVLIDRYTGYQVWNQPLAGYRFEYPKREDYLGNTRENPNVYRILLNSRIWWLDDGVHPDVLTPPFNYSDNEVTTSRELRMEVWLDGPVEFDSAGKIVSSGNVIVTSKDGILVGGAWKVDPSSDAWPDYMWVPYRVMKAIPDPDQDFVNPEVEIEWLEKHLLPRGGVDDPSVTPGSVEAPPAVRPSGGPRPFPTSTSTSTSGTGSGTGWPASAGTPLPAPFPTGSTTSFPATGFPGTNPQPMPGPPGAPAGAPPSAPNGPSIPTAPSGPRAP